MVRALVGDSTMIRLRAGIAYVGCVSVNKVVYSTPRLRLAMRWRLEALLDHSYVLLSAHVSQVTFELQECELGSEHAYGKL